MVLLHVFLSVSFLQINFCHLKRHWTVATMTRFQRKVGLTWTCCFCLSKHTRYTLHMLLTYTYRDCIVTCWVGLLCPVFLCAGRRGGGVPVCACVWIHVCVYIFVYVCLMGSFLLNIVHISDIIAWCVFDICVCVCVHAYIESHGVCMCVFMHVYIHRCVCEVKLGECRGRCVSASIIHFKSLFAAHFKLCKWALYIQCIEPQGRRFTNFHYYYYIVSMFTCTGTYVCARVCT